MDDIVESESEFHLKLESNIELKISFLPFVFQEDGFEKHMLKAHFEDIKLDYLSKANT